MTIVLLFVAWRGACLPPRIVSVSTIYVCIVYVCTVYVCTVYVCTVYACIVYASSTASTSTLRHSQPKDRRPLRSQPKTSTDNTIKYYVYPEMMPRTEKLRELVALAHETVVQLDLRVKAVLIRSGLHSTMSFAGGYVRDLMGVHATISFKTEEQLLRGTHDTYHCYNRGEVVWPPADELELISDFGYGYLP
ncbi:Uncharacterized protein PECH_003231 [Penicillium ucsense]|uniref:Uncharacterized protein n=1 Tax=Penicillium ucsense TaxID=2839758 RepID=A0A8J8VW63_9EURO|nr:Uncharacterized protein PECM_002771 [Penicillium ucsense]KAF7729788.1 Uncharacterized protein PECH_003231 [Penicillium ucsense]